MVLDVVLGAVERPQVMVLAVVVADPFPRIVDAVALHRRERDLGHPEAPPEEVLVCPLVVGMVLPGFVFANAPRGQDDDVAFELKTRVWEGHIAIGKHADQVGRAVRLHGLRHGVDVVIVGIGPSRRHAVGALAAEQTAIVDPQREGVDIGVGKGIQGLLDGHLQGLRLGIVRVPFLVTEILGIERRDVGRPVGVLGKHLRVVCQNFRHREDVDHVVRRVDQLMPPGNLEGVIGREKVPLLVHEAAVAVDAIGGIPVVVAGMGPAGHGRRNADVHYRNAEGLRRRIAHSQVAREHPGDPEKVLQEMHHAEACAHGGVSADPDPVLPFVGGDDLEGVDRRDVLNIRRGEFVPGGRVGLDQDVDGSARPGKTRFAEGAQNVSLDQVAHERPGRTEGVGYHDHDVAVSVKNQGALVGRGADGKPILLPRGEPGGIECPHDLPVAHEGQAGQPVICPVRARLQVEGDAGRAAEFEEGGVDDLDVVDERWRLSGIDEGELKGRAGGVQAQVPGCLRGHRAQVEHEIGGVGDHRGRRGGDEIVGHPGERYEAAVQGDGHGCPAVQRHLGVRVQTSVMAQPEDQGGVVVDGNVPVYFNTAALFDGDDSRAHLADEHVVGSIQEGAGAADGDLAEGGSLGTIEILRQDRAATGDVESGCACVPSQVERVAIPQ